jgi:hypothetical protein
MISSLVVWGLGLKGHWTMLKTNRLATMMMAMRIAAETRAVLLLLFEGGGGGGGGAERMTKRFILSLTEEYC